MLNYNDLKNVIEIIRNYNNIKKILKKNIKREDILDFINNNLNSDIPYTSFIIKKNGIGLKNENGVQYSFDITFYPNIENFSKIQIRRIDVYDAIEYYELEFQEEKLFITKEFFIGTTKQTTYWEYYNEWLIKQTKQYVSQNKDRKEITYEEAYVDLKICKLMKKYDSYVMFADKTKDLHEIKYEGCNLDEYVNINFDSLINRRGDNLLDNNNSWFVSASEASYESFINALKEKHAIKEKTL